MNILLLLSIAVAAAMLVGFMTWAAQELRLTLRWMAQPSPQGRNAVPDRMPDRMQQTDFEQAYEELLSR